MADLQREGRWFSAMDLASILFGAALTALFGFKVLAKKGPKPSENPLWRRALPAVVRREGNRRAGP